QEELAQARERALQHLPASVRQALEALYENEPSGPSVEKLVQAVLGLDVKEQGLAVDTLYELATPAAVAAARQVSRQIPFDQAHRWRYVKSVLRRAMLRHDYATFGELLHAVEVQGRTSKGTTAAVKSGYDGVQRETPIFQRKTQNYVRR